MEKIGFSVVEDLAGKRLDALLKEQFPEFSRTYFQFLIDEGMVLVNGKPLKKREKPNFGDQIEVKFQVSPEMDLIAEDIPLDILYEDEDIIAINKPAGMVVHPAPGHTSGTFVNALLYHCKDGLAQCDDPLRPGVVHRLDKDTTGVLIGAKTRAAHQNLIELFKNRHVAKEYLALTIGNPGTKTIRNSIGRHPTKRKEMCIRNEGGKESVSHVTPIITSECYAFVKIYLETGRTHQARVHLRSAGTPILGDPTYGNRGHNEKVGIHRQLLHASQISLPHPITGKPLTISAPLPEDFERIKKNLLAE